MVNILYYSVLYALPILAASLSDDAKPKPDPKTPCAVKSPLTGGFFDLNAVNLKLPDPEKKASSSARNTSWAARGYDYGANFTLNICGSVLEKLDGVEGIPDTRVKNISAFYERDGLTYSIGAQNDAPIFRGRKLILNYTDGSPCPSEPVSHSEREVRLDRVQKRALIGGEKGSNDDGKKGKDEDEDDNDDDDDDKKEDKAPAKRPASSKTRRKSTIINLVCTQDPVAPLMAVSFLGSIDSCTYFFEARTPAACEGVNAPQQSLGPAGVFGVIALIAILVYVAGGCVYQRTVMHQRGWRQLPNYSLWAGIGSFFKDMTIIAFSSCTRWVPNKSGYRRLDTNGYAPNGNNRSRGGRHDADAENRLIDELDEDWGAE